MLEQGWKTVVVRVSPGQGFANSDTRGGWRGVISSPVGVWGRNEKPRGWVRLGCGKKTLRVSQPRGSQVEKPSLQIRRTVPCSGGKLWTSFSELGFLEGIQNSAGILLSVTSLLGWVSPSANWEAQAGSELINLEALATEVLEGYNGNLTYFKLPMIYFLLKEGRRKEGRFKQDQSGP